VKIEHELERTRRELRALEEVAKALVSPLDFDSMLSAIMTSFSKVLDSVDAGAIMLWDAPSGKFWPGAVFGYDATLLGEIQLRAGESLTGMVFDLGIPVLLKTPDEVAEVMDNLQPSNREIMQRALGADTPPRSAVAAVIKIDEQKIGVLVLESLEGPVDFLEEDLRFVQMLADLIALAIDRSYVESKEEVKREERKIGQLRSEIMATLSHELRTPLAAIKGYSTALLLDEIDWPAEKQKEFLGLIDEECNNLQVMIGDMLDASIIDAGQMVIQKQPVRLPILVKDIAEEMQFRTDAHKIIVEFPDDFPIVDIDPRKITQVVRNILDNSIKYSPNGGLIVIRGQVRPKDVVISVADQGVGISPEDLIPLFEKYFRVKASTGYHIAGTGLGLPVARSLVEAHGGKIWAESEVEEGTSLYFSLPRKGWSTEAGPA
jgi:signal transduction histidine kinase